VKPVYTSAASSSHRCEHLTRGSQPLDEPPPRGSGVAAFTCSMVALGECLGLGVPDVAQIDQLVRAPRALAEDEVRRLLCGTGLRLAEAAALDGDDVHTTDRTGAVHVRAGKGERPRTVPMPATIGRTSLAQTSHGGPVVRQEQRSAAE